MKTTKLTFVPSEEYRFIELFLDYNFKYEQCSMREWYWELETLFELELQDWFDNNIKTGTILTNYGDDLFIYDGGKFDKQNDTFVVKGKRIEIDNRRQYNDNHAKEIYICNEELIASEDLLNYNKCVTIVTDKRILRIVNHIMELDEMM